MKVPGTRILECARAMHKLTMTMINHLGRVQIYTQPFYSF